MLVVLDGSVLKGSRWRDWCVESCPWFVFCWRELLGCLPADGCV